MADDLAHEIKNPLNSMVINLEVMRSRARKGDADGVIERAAVIESEVLRLNGLIDGVLKLLRPDRSGVAPFSVGGLFDEIGKVVALQAKLARRSLEVTGVDLPQYAAGPRNAVRFAILNILADDLANSAEDSILTLEGTSDASGTIIRISSVPASSEGAADPMRRRTAVETAAALIGQAGGSVTDVPSGDDGRRVATLTLPVAQSA
jgi:signal transduction histidine kinase